MTDADTTRQLNNWIDQTAVGFGLAIIGIIVGPAKINPGGPFLSVTGDLLPICASIYTIRVALLLLRTPRRGVKLYALGVVSLATLLLAGALLNVVSFAVAPNSRGAFISY